VQIKVNKTKLLICFGVSAVITIAVLLIKGVFSAETTKEMVMILSDAFFLGGALILVVAGLVWASDNGVSDGIGYSFSKLFNLRKRDYEEHKESYSEYKDRKHAKKSSVIEFLISGVSFVFISVVFLLIYLQF
jgi:hypothetical protein